MLDLIIWDLAELESAKGACITAQLMGVWPRLNSIEALLTYHMRLIPDFSKTIKAIKKFADCCHGPSNRRNRAIHDPWYSEQNNQNLVQRRSMPRGALTYELKEIDKADIADLINQIVVLSSRAIELRNEISATLKSIT
jgi:hypothetical protein